MKLTILAFLCLVVKQSESKALNLNLRAFPEHILANENEAFEQKCAGLQTEFFHPKWVFTRDDLIQADLRQCKSRFCR